MTWFKVDDQLAFHPKVIEAGNSAMGLWVRAGAWCGAHLTEGALPKHMIGTLGAQARDAKRLVEVGLWEQTDVGFQFRDWDEYQPTKKQVEADKAANRERQKRFRDRRRNAETNDVSNTVRNAVTTAVTNGTPTRPDPTNKKDMRIDADARFEDWWSHYPRKKARGQAEKAYRTALKHTDHETLVAAVKAYAKSVADKDPEYIAYGSTWLNGKRWMDDDIAPADPESIRGWLGDCWKQADTKSVEERSGLTFRPADASPAEDEDITSFNRRMRQQWIADHHDEIIRRIMAREASAA